MEHSKFNLIMCPGMNIRLDDAPHSEQGAFLDFEQTTTFANRIIYTFNICSLYSNCKEL